MSEIVSERNEEQLEQMRTRFARFGMSGADLEERMAAAKYVTGPVQPGEYTVILEMNGKTQSKTATIIPDYWYK
jgi:hypothetical protein